MLHTTYDSYLYMVGNKLAMLCRKPYESQGMIPPSLQINMGRAHKVVARLVDEGLDLVWCWGEWRLGHGLHTANVAWTIYRYYMLDRALVLVFAVDRGRQEPLLLGFYDSRAPAWEIDGDREGLLGDFAHADRVRFRKNARWYEGCILGAPFCGQAPLAPWFEELFVPDVADRLGPREARETRSTEGGPMR